jgi:hypothetical protein
MAALARRFIANIELYLTGAGLVVAFLVPVVLGPSHFWQSVAVTALVVSIVHGMLLWVIRRRQRRIRKELIAEVRGMLKDRVNNQLQVLFEKAVHVQVEAADSTTYPTAAQLADVFEATREVARTIDQISDDALSRWKDTYRHVIEPTGA